MFPTLIIALFILLGLGIVSATVVFILRLRFQTQGKLSHSLGLALLQIQLPRESKKEESMDRGIAEIREKVAMMEQVFGQFANIEERGFHAWLYGKPFFSFEIAVPHVGQEVLFFCAVPRRYAIAAEKLIQGVYPEAHIEVVKDFTIFTPESAVATATAHLHSRTLPLRTFQTLDSDPLGSILNAFSKVAHQGEGLALQFVCQKASMARNHELSKIARHLRKGKHLSQAIMDANRSETLKAINPETKEEKEEKSGPVNDNLVQMVETKSQKPLFQANIRIVAAAPTRARADALLQEVILPFSQFNNGETNSLYFAKENGRALQKTVYQFSFRTPDAGSAVILSSEELSSMVHLPNTVLGIAQVASVKAKMASAPFNLPKEGMLIGTNAYRGAEVPIYIMPEDRARHFYIIGQTGTGKSYLMRNMIIQDIKNGEGVCFIDPHGDSVEAILEQIPPNRIKDVVYFNPGDVSRPMGLNMLEFDLNFPEQKTFIINELLEIFNKLYDMKTAGGPMFEQYFRNATGLVMEDPESGNTLLEINRVLSDKKFRDYKLSKCKNPLITAFWRDIAEKAGGEAALSNIVPYISSKFDSFLSNEIMRPIVAQEKSAFRLRDIMDNKKILLINLSKGRLGELNSSLIGLILIGKLFMAALSRVDIPEKDRKNLYLYVDEFQNVTTDSIEKILSEARKYRLNMILAHQFIGQLSEEISKAVFGNVGSIAAFRIGPEDGEFMEKQFAPIFNRTDLINIDNRNCYVKLLVNGQTAPAFSMKTLPSPEGKAEVAQAAKDYSRLTYGRDRAEVEAEVMAKFAALQKPAPTAPTVLPTSQF